MATVAKRGDTYKITVSVGYDMHGKQVRLHKTWTPNEGLTKRQIEKELERQKLLFEEECTGGNVANGNIKFEAFARQWFKEYAEPRLKTRTIDLYHSFEKRVYKALGHLRMDKITTRTVQKFILNLGEDGVNQRTKKGLSPKSIKNYLSFLSTVFDYAVRQGVVKENPCKTVSLPSVQTAEIDYYTLEETQQFLELLEQEPFNWRMFFTLRGLWRLSSRELFGLEWTDIDFDNCVVTINRTSSYTKARGIYTETPKTKQSYRCLKLPQPIITMLRQYKAAQAEERLKLGDKWIHCNRLFVDWQGKPRSPESARRWLERFCKKTGIRKVNVHSFRHLNASLLITGGADVKTVSAALGHTQATTTLNIYAHTFAAAQARATDAIADILTLDKKAE